MTMNTEYFSGTAKGHASNPLGIIALFIVLVYGMATLVITQSDTLRQGDITALVCFLISFPVIVFGGFLWMVTQHHFKLYAPKDYDNDDGFFISVLIAAAAIQRKNSEKQLSLNELKDIANELRDSASKSIRQRNTKRKESSGWTTTRTTTCMKGIYLKLQE